VRLLLLVMCLAIAGCSESNSTSTQRATEVVEVTAQPAAAP